MADSNAGRRPKTRLPIAHTTTIGERAEDRWQERGDARDCCRIGIAAWTATTAVAVNVS